MHWAATGGSLDVCKYLAEHGCDPLQLNNEGTAPLHWAAGSGNKDVLDWLLDEQGALIDAKNVFGCTIAHFASSSGQLEMCQYLYNARGVDFKCTNSHGHDPLTKSIAFKKCAVTRWLLESVAGVIDTLNELKPWDDNGFMTLSEIAELVGNTEGMRLLDEYSNRLEK
jgi:ankyrin repeat protein